MDFEHYTDCSVVLATDLVNTLSLPSGRDTLTDAAALQRFLADHEVSFGGTVSQEDVVRVRALRSRLREVFLAGDADTVAARLNTLLADAGALPQLTNHDGQRWHFHFRPNDGSLEQWLAAETAMGLATVFRDHGIARLATCAAPDCDDAFVDTSRNRSRRYCDAATCGNRAHVAAYRQRRAGARH